MMNTFIADGGGNKVDFIEGRCPVGNLTNGYTAKYCTCTESTTNTSAITDWATAEDVSYEVSE